MGRTLCWKKNITLDLKCIRGQGRKCILSSSAWKTAAGSFANDVEQKGSTKDRISSPELLEKDSAGLSYLVL
jgi:hypothetical protein